MSSLMAVYQQLCTEERLPKPRQKDVLTALRYLAAAHDTTPDKLLLTSEIESTYKAQLREYLTAKKKGASTIRNAIQCVGQFLRAYHQFPAKTRIPQAEDTGNPATMNASVAGKMMFRTSRYRHSGWMTHDRYVLKGEDIPQDIRDGFGAYLKIKQIDELKDRTLEVYSEAIRAYVSYLLMTVETRLAHLPVHVQSKLANKRYAADLSTITETPTGATWDDIFDVKRLQSFVCWLSWRRHTADEASVLHKAPPKPTTRGETLVDTVLGIANSLKHPAADAIFTYGQRLPEPTPVRNKQADEHKFDVTELDDIARTLMDEARHMVIQASKSARTTGIGVYKHPGKYPATRFKIGLVLMLGWRIPMRLRNWNECLLGAVESEGNLRKVNGKWRFHFEGAELKVRERRGELNTFDREIPSDVVPYLEEYLYVWRPMLPNAANHRYVFPSSRPWGGPMGRRGLYISLRAHVYRFGGKQFFVHLLRTMFYSNAIKDHVPSAVAAWGIGDSIATANRHYLEADVEAYEQIMKEHHARQLNANSNGKAH